MGVFESGQHCVEVAARLLQREAAKAVVAAEFDDDDRRMQQQDGEMCIRDSWRLRWPASLTR